MPIASPSSPASTAHASLPVSSPSRNEAAGRTNKPAPRDVLQSLRIRNGAIADAHQTFTREVAAYLFPSGNRYAGLEKLHQAASALIAALHDAESASPESHGALEALMAESRKDLPAQNLQNRAGLSLLLERLQTAMQKYVSRNASERNFQIEDAPPILAALEDYWDKLHAEPLHRHNGMGHILTRQNSSASVMSSSSTASPRSTADLHGRIRDGLAAFGGARTANQGTPTTNISPGPAAPSAPHPEAADEHAAPTPAQESIHSPEEPDVPGMATEMETANLPGYTPYFQPVPSDVEGLFVAMSPQEQEYADRLLYKLQHTGKYASAAGALISLRNAMFPSTKELGQLKELLGNRSLPHRELREYILDKLLDHIPTNPDFNVNDRERLIRLYQRYLSPNHLDTGHYNHAQVVLQARDGHSGTINQQMLVSDAALMRILPKLLNIAPRISEQEEVIVGIAIHNLRRLQTENPWGHAILLGELATARKRNHLYRTEKDKLNEAILQGAKLLTEQVLRGSSGNADDLADALARANYVKKHLTGREALDGTETFRQLSAACSNPDISWDIQPPPEPPEPPTPPYSAAP